MKKIITMALVAIAFASATFALDFEIGAKIIAGQNVADGSTATETVKGVTADSNFEFGAAAYANFALFGGLGVQVEPTVIKSNVTFAGNTMTVNQEYDALTLDVPVMVWLNLDLWKLTIGAGAGVDFSMELDRNASLKDATNAATGAVIEAAKAKDLSKTSFAWIVGADGKFYLTNHIGIVASVRYIMDINKKDVPVTVGLNDKAVDTGITYPSIEYGRRFLYGGVGLEFKFF